MRSRSITLCIALLCAPLLASAGETIYVQVPAALDPLAPIANTVKNQCDIEHFIGNQVFENVKKRFPGAAEIQDVGKAGQSKVLQLNIIGVHGIGGGGWTGSKYILVRTQLLQNGQILNKTVLQRGSRGGVFGPAMGTCAIMERIAATIGEDAANWLSGVMAKQSDPVEAPASSATKEGVN